MAMTSSKSHPIHSLLVKFVVISAKTHILQDAGFYSNQTLMSTNWSISMNQMGKIHHLQ